MPSRICHPLFSPPQLYFISVFFPGTTNSGKNFSGTTFYNTSSNFFNRKTQQKNQRCKSPPADRNVLAVTLFI